MEYINKETRDGKIVKLKNYKRRALINRIKRRLFIALFIIIILIIVLLNAPFMQIKMINCVGNRFVTSEEIVKSSQIYKGNNILRINKSKSIDLIKTNPYIKNVIITRKLPSTININVEECQVCAYIKHGNKYLYIDNESKVLEINSVPPKNKIPLISGVTVTKSNVNEIVGLKNEIQLQYIKGILNSISNSNFMGMVTLIDVKNTEKSKFIVNNNLEIIIGNDENLEYKINFLAESAYDSLGENQAGYLDVSHGGKAIFKEKT